MEKNTPVRLCHAADDVLDDRVCGLAVTKKST